MQMRGSTTLVRPCFNIGIWAVLVQGGALRSYTPHLTWVLTNARTMEHGEWALKGYYVRTHAHTQLRVCQLCKQEWSLPFRLGLQTLKCTPSGLRGMETIAGKGGRRRTERTAA